MYYDEIFNMIKQYQDEIEELCRKVGEEISERLDFNQKVNYNNTNKNIINQLGLNDIKQVLKFKDYSVEDEVFETVVIHATPTVYNKIRTSKNDGHIELGILCNLKYYQEGDKIFDITISTDDYSFPFM